MHFHPSIEIILHATGRGSTSIAGERIEFAEGSIFVHAPGEWHEQTMHTSGVDHCVQIALPSRLDVALHEGFYVPPLNTSWLQEDLQHLSRSYGPTGRFEQRIFDLRATAVLLELVRLAGSVSRVDALPPAERHVLNAVRFIQENFQVLKSLQEVADHVGLSHDHLRHIFKQLKGESLVRHVAKVRIARAKILLTSTPLPLKQIATACGFRDEYYFSSTFRKLVKIAPNGYRQNALAVAKSLSQRARFPG